MISSSRRAFSLLTTPSRWHLPLAGLLLAGLWGCDALFGEGGASRSTSPVRALYALRLSLSPLALPADGRSTAALTTFLSSTSEPIAGVAVELSIAGQSTFAATGTQRAVATTDEAGAARATLVAGLTPGTEVVHASIPPFTTASLEYEILAAAPSLRVDVTREWAPANGTTLVPVVGTLSLGPVPLAGVGLLFRTTHGCFDTPRDGMAASCPVRQATDAGGQAVVWLQVPLMPPGQVSQTVTVSAVIDPREGVFAPVASDALEVVNASEVRWIRLGDYGVADCGDFAEGIRPGGSCTVSLRVTDSGGAGLEEMVVDFSVDGPAWLAPGGEILTDRGGVATVLINVIADAMPAVITLTAGVGTKARCDLCGEGWTAYGATLRRDLRVAPPATPLPTPTATPTATIVPTSTPTATPSVTPTPTCRGDPLGVGGEGSGPC